jgi:hypothetical protein
LLTFCFLFGFRGQYLKEMIEEEVIVDEGEKLSLADNDKVVVFFIGEQCPPGLLVVMHWLLLGRGQRGFQD